MNADKNVPAKLLDIRGMQSGEPKLRILLQKRTYVLEAFRQVNYEAIMKSILHSLGNSLTPRLTGARPVELLSAEFESVEKRIPDIVARLDDGRIFHLEVQSYNDTRMPQRMLRYWLLLHERYNMIPITQHVLYIGNAPCSMASKINVDLVTYEYLPWDIRDIDEEVLLCSGSPADRTLAVLSRMRNERQTIRRILSSWADMPRRELSDLVEKLVLLSGLRGLDRTVLEEVHNMPVVIDIMENETIRGWIEQGIERGITQGIERGIERGRQGQAAQILTKLLTKRFGIPPPARVQEIATADSAQIERWTLRLMDVSTLEEVFAE